jgi:hypothetical protein
MKRIVDCPILALDTHFRSPLHHGARALHEDESVLLIDRACCFHAVTTIIPSFFTILTTPLFPKSFFTPPTVMNHGSLMGYSVKKVPTARDVHNSYGKYIRGTHSWCVNIRDRGLGHSGEPEFVVRDVRLPPIEPLPVLWGSTPNDLVHARHAEVMLYL